MAGNERRAHLSGRPEPPERQRGRVEGRQPTRRGRRARDVGRMPAPFVRSRPSASEGVSKADKLRPRASDVGRLPGAVRQKPPERQRGHRRPTSRGRRANDVGRELGAAARWEPGRAAHVGRGRAGDRTPRSARRAGLSAAPSPHGGSRSSTSRTLIERCPAPTCSLTITESPTSDRPCRPLRSADLDRAARCAPGARPRSRGGARRDRTHFPAGPAHDPNARAPTGAAARKGGSKQ